MRLLRLALALSALVGAGCGSEGESGQPEGPILDPRGADGPVVVEDPGYTAEPGPEKLPPLLDPQSLADAEPPGVPLPQLIGLTLKDAQTWADQSGFALTEDPVEGAFAPHIRIVVTVINGRVARATAG